MGICLFWVIGICLSFHVVRVPGSMPLFSPNTEACNGACNQKKNACNLIGASIIKLRNRNKSPPSPFCLWQRSSGHLSVREDLPPWKGNYCSVWLNLNKGNKPTKDEKLRISKFKSFRTVAINETPDTIYTIFCILSQTCIGYGRRWTLTGSSGGFSSK